MQPSPSASHMTHVAVNILVEVQVFHSDVRHMTAAMLADRPTSRMLAPWLSVALISFVSVSGQVCDPYSSRVDCGKLISLRQKMAMSTYKCEAACINHAHTHSFLLPPPPSPPPKGYVGITEGQCQTKGCCWYPADVSSRPCTCYKFANTTS